MWLADTGEAGLHQSPSLLFQSGAMFWLPPHHPFCIPLQCICSLFTHRLPVHPSSNFLPATSPAPIHPSDEISSRLLRFKLELNHGCGRIVSLSSFNTRNPPETRSAEFRPECKPVHRPSLGTSAGRANRVQNQQRIHIHITPEPIVDATPGDKRVNKPLSSRACLGQPQPKNGNNLPHLYTLTSSHLRHPNSSNPQTRLQ